MDARKYWVASGLGEHYDEGCEDGENNTPPKVDWQGDLTDEELAYMVGHNTGFERYLTKSYIRL